MNASRAVRNTIVIGLMAATFANPRTIEPASAATATTTLAVSATVLSLCLVVAAPLVFGNYSSAQLDGTGLITVTCTTGTSYNVGLDQGTGTGATVTTRKMTGALGGTLSYSLYQDAARSTLWGNTVGTNTATGTATGLPQVLTAYGRIAAAQYPPTGAFTDTVTVTVTY